MNCEALPDSGVSVFYSLTVKILQLSLNMQLVSASAKSCLMLLHTYYASIIDSGLPAPLLTANKMRTPTPRISCKIARSDKFPVTVCNYFGR